MAEKKLTEKQFKALQIGSDELWHRDYELVPSSQRNQARSAVVSSLVSAHLLSRKYGGYAGCFLFRITADGREVLNGVSK